MKTKLHWLFIFCIAFSVNSLFAQEVVENKPQGPIYVGTPDRVDQVPSIASRAHLIEPVDLVSGKPKVMQDGRAYKYEVIPGKGSKGADILAKNPHRLKNAIPTRAPLLVFETAASSSQPTDPSIAVGPNHVVAVTNTAFRIFDKDGNPLTALVAPNPTIFPNGGCCDLTASYDNAADRFVLSFLGGGVQIAVSNGPDPVNDGWTSYAYGVVSDYQKLSVWSDGYYMTENTGAGQKLHVFDRTAMLNGDATAAIQSFVLPGLVTSGFHSPQVLNISDDTIPSAGNATVIYMQDDAWGGVANDHVKLWDVNVDFVTPANSLVSAAVELGNAEGVSPFISVFDGGGFSNLTQPGGGVAIDALQATIMNQAQFRKFPTYNSALFNFVVDVDGSAVEQAGIRWYELRQTGDGQPWTVYQEGTYTGIDNRHAWHASLIMDGQGNIGMGYSTMSSANSADPNVRVSSMYTGQLVSSSGTGTMDVAEETIMIGDANIPGLRYGDYSKIDIDPDGDKKFWFVNELMQSGRKNIAGVFQLAPNLANDVGVISVDTPVTGALSNAETVTVTVFNFGENDASGFDVTYQVDGGATITEAFAGTLASATSAQHTFTTTADLSTEGQTYVINSCTVYGADEDNGNDCTSSSITHVAADDIGVTAITAPVSGEGLGMETVTVTIENFGTSDQTGFDVNYIIDGGTPVTETVGANVPAGGTISYPFTTLADLSAVATYAFTSSTLLAGDADTSNDTASTSVTNLSCQTQTESPGTAVGPNAGTTTESIITFTDDFAINDVNVTVDIAHTWVGDLTITLIAPDGTTEVELMADGTCGNCDDMTVTFDDAAADPIGGAAAPISGTFQPSGSLATLDGLMSAGDWTLRILDGANGDGGTFNSWDLQLCSDGNLSVDEVLVNEGFEVIYEENNQFFVNLQTTTINERLNLNVTNTLGQNLMWRTLENETGNGYQYRIDMSHVAAGVYFVKIGNNNKSNVKRIIVK